MDWNDSAVSTNPDRGNRNSVPIRQGEPDMTKTKARQRAKTKAGQKAKKREASADQPGQKIPPGKFDPGPGSIKSPLAKSGGKNFAVARRGAARSR
jgi:hypothetical protein